MEAQRRVDAAVAEIGALGEEWLDLAERLGMA